MIDRARDIVKMMGYESLDGALAAIGRGELILLKLPGEQRLSASLWMREQIPQVRTNDADLAETLDDVADGLEMALELTRYPADTDVCDLDLPHGWPSYCDKEAIR
jgi:hypothetical protein